MSVAAGQGVVYFCDAGDNPTAGGVEDRADFLAAALERRRTGLVFAPLVAPDAVAAARDRVGATAELTVGGQLGGGGPRLRVSASVEAWRYDMPWGETAIVRIGGNRVILTDRRVAMHGPEFFQALGLDPVQRGCQMVLKSGYLFPAYQDLLARHGGEAHLVATPGASSLDLATFHYERVPRPIFPLACGDAVPAPALRVYHRVRGETLVTRVVSG